MRRINLAALCFLQITHCATSSAQSPIQFAEIEHRLLNAQALSLDFQVIATGAVQATIGGALSKIASSDIELSAAGVFAGQNIDLVAIQRGAHFEYGHRQNPSSVEPPEKLWEALIIGFTRMGILHNIATLSAGAMPDHAEGGVADWVVATNVTSGDQTFTFDILVSDIPSGSATLAIGELRNPETRRQNVAFSSGAMQVVETYSNFSKSE